MQYAAAVGEYLSVPSGRRPVDQRSTRQRVKVEVLVSVEDRVYALDVETDDGGHELMPYRKASIHPCYRLHTLTHSRASCWQLPR